MKQYLKYFTIAFIFMIAGTLKAQSILSYNFENYTIGDSLATISWTPGDIQSKVADDPLASGNNVLRNVVHNYGAAPVLMFVLPTGKTLADYDSLTFKGYFQKGDVAYKLIVAQAFQTKPSGPFEASGTDTLGSYNRAQGASTAWENIGLDITNTSAFTDTVYIALGINCAGTSGTDTTTWFADNIQLVEKAPTITPVLSYDFESNTIGDSLYTLSYTPGDIQSKVADDPLASGNNVLKNVVHNYGAAPVLTFVLPTGKTLADYDSLTFKGYFQKGDVAYKLIVAQAFQTKPSGPFEASGTDTLGSYNRAQGASTAWENIGLDITNASTFTDTVYIALGINCAGTSGTDTTTWFADNVQLVAKGVAPPPPPPPPPPPTQVVTNGGFEDSPVGVDTTGATKGWIFQSANATTPPVFEIVSDTVEEGSRALKVTVKSLGTNSYDLQAVSDSIHVVPGVTYNYSIWAKADVPGTQVDFTVGNYSYSEYGAIRPANLTTQWKKYTMQFKVNDGQSVIRGPISFGYSGNINNAIYIDNLQIADVNAPKKPLIVEAESGALGSNFAVAQDSPITYITAKTNWAGLSGPGDSSRVATYQVTFPDSGYYSLFAHVRVGPNGFNDDSFFYGNGFGVKNDTLSTDWVLINGIASGGFTDADTSAVVDGAGTAGTSVWKWANITKNTYSGAPGDTFYVSPDSLTRTFQIGSREDGLDIDKIAFGKSYLTYTVNQLNKVLPGGAAPTVDSSLIWKGPALATGEAKFLGSAYGQHNDNIFYKYWNQLTPENAGKWGSVATSQDTTQWNWSGLDAAYNYAQNHNLIFKDHNLIWGQQQPSWISGLDSATQYKYIEYWIRKVGEKYPNTDMIDVVNEPLPGHNPPDGQNGRANYEKALGGAGSTGWDWVVNAFKLARKYLPNAKLLVNDYNIINNNSATTTYLQLINILKDSSLIDGIGVQAHRFSLENTDTSVIGNNLRRLGATGLPVYASELDLGNVGDTGTPSDNIQTQLYRKYFPVFWKSPAVKGITLWGYLEGYMWQTTCFLVHSNLESRPAFTWLVNYIKSNPTGIEKTVSTVPTSFKLDQNFPNPFNPSTKIRYSIAKASRVTLKIYDILGREVQTLVNEQQAPGQYTVTFNAQNLASGVYFYRISAGNFSEVKKLMLLK